MFKLFSCETFYKNSTYATHINFIAHINIVKVHGVFPSAARTPHLHGEFNFTELVLETVDSRYAIHAGHQLNAKEFRYLWTVRVTAAVY